MRMHMHNAQCTMHTRTWNMHMRMHCTRTIRALHVRRCPCTARTGRAAHVRRRYAAWLDLVDDLGLVEIGLGVETGLGGVFKGQYKGQFTREKAPLCFELTY